MSALKQASIEYKAVGWGNYLMAESAKKALKASFRTITKRVRLPVKQTLKL